jgi:hypothetical protein
MDAAYDSGDALTILGFVALHFHPSYFITFMRLLWKTIGCGFGFAAFMMYLILWLMANRNLTLLYCYWIYGIRNDAGDGRGGFIGILGYGNFFGCF